MAGAVFGNVAGITPDAPHLVLDITGRFICDGDQS